MNEGAMTRARVTLKGIGIFQMGNTVNEVRCRVEELPGTTPLLVQQQQRDSVQGAAFDSGAWETRAAPSVVLG